MARTVVGVLRGGTSQEYDLSLKTGATILNALPESDYDTRDILIDKNGLWHARGFPVDPTRALSQVDVVLNALHGGVGEDGTVQRILEKTGVPYVGSRPLASSLALNKLRAREVFAHAGIRMPRGLGFSASDGRDTGEMARSVFAIMGPPYIVKPVFEGASHGIGVAQTIVDLPHVLADVLEAYGNAVVEEYLRGEDATVGIVEHFRDEDLYAFPPTHIVLPHDAQIFHSDHHRAGGHTFIVPSNFDRDHKRDLIAMAKQAHRALGLSHYSRADFIVTPYGPYLLEVNAYPAFHEHAAFPKMLESVGSSVKDFLGHVIDLARK